MTSEPNPPTPTSADSLALEEIKKRIEANEARFADLVNAATIGLQSLAREHRELCESCADTDRRLADLRGYVDDIDDRLSGRSPESPLDAIRARLDDIERRMDNQVSLRPDVIDLREARALSERIAARESIGAVLRPAPNADAPPESEDQGTTLNPKP